MSGCGSLKVCGWLAGASVRAARCGLVQSGRAACAQPVPRMRSSTESYPARHRPRRDDRRHRATRIQSLSVCLSVNCLYTAISPREFLPCRDPFALPSKRSHRHGPKNNGRMDEHALVHGLVDGDRVAVRCATRVAARATAARQAPAYRLAAPQCRRAAHVQRQQLECRDRGVGPRHRVTAKDHVRLAA